MDRDAVGGWQWVLVYPVERKNHLLTRFRSLYISPEPKSRFPRSPWTQIYRLFLPVVINVTTRLFQIHIPNVSPNKVNGSLDISHLRVKAEHPGDMVRTLFQESWRFPAEPRRARQIPDRRKVQIYP